MRDILFKQCDKSNYKQGREQPIKYIVVHYTGNNGDTAKNNAVYFAGNINLKASAHYFVDENEIWQSVADENTAWHCGTSGTYKHPECRNVNSIGIELCSRKDANGKYFFRDGTVLRAVSLLTSLIEKYNITPDRILRHYDVTGKICPAPFVDNYEKWIEFLNMTDKLTGAKNTIQKKCGFSYPQGVWDTLDTHPHAYELYQKWAASYI